MKKDIILKNVTKEYSKYNNDLKRLIGVLFPWTKIPKAKVLDDISFEINQGERVALIGKNGSGKSTILKIISGITTPTLGKVIVNRRVNTLLEVNAGFSPEFTGRENIYIRGALLGLSRKQIKEVESKILEFAEISSDFIDQQLKRYSSGMVAKLGFAINLLCHPEILIIDEALAVGDVSFKNKCIKFIRELSKKSTVTILFVSHDEIMVKEFCNRGIFIKDSKIVIDDKIDKVFKEYNKTYNNKSLKEKKGKN